MQEEIAKMRATPAFNTHTFTHMHTQTNTVETIKMEYQTKILKFEQQITQIKTENSQLQFEIRTLKDKLCLIENKGNLQQRIIIGAQRTEPMMRPR